MRIKYLLRALCAAVALVGAGALGCGLINDNILNTDIRLQKQVYSQDFGARQGTVPEVPCSSAADVCQQVTDLLQGAPARGVCDAQAARCYAEANIALTYKVDLSKDQNFQSSVGTKAVSFVRAVKFSYSLNPNTLTFDVPEIGIFLGPQDAKKTTDPGVIHIGNIGPFPRGTTISESTPMTLELPDKSPARDQLVRNVQNPKVPFVFLVAATPRIRSGDPLPAGKMELQVIPQITVGIPR